MRFPKPAARSANLALCLVFALVSAAHGAESPWDWPQHFNAASSDELRDLHWQIHGLGQPPGLGYIVEGLTLETDCLEIHFLDGVLYPDLEIDGRLIGVYFRGRASVDFHPRTRYGRVTLESRFGATGLEEEPVSSLYVYSLQEENVIEQLDLAGPPSVPFDAQEDYEMLKGSLRLSGTSLTHAFLERDGAARGLVAAVMRMDRIAQGRAEDALVRYDLDPRDEKAVAISVAGHPSIHTRSEYRDYFNRISSCEGPDAWLTQAEVERYSIDMSLEGSSPDVTQRARLSLSLNLPLRSLRLSLSPRMQVSEVRKGGEPLPFMQWKWRENAYNRDRQLIVDLGGRHDEGATLELEVFSEGPLLLPAGGNWMLPEEDDWHPRLDDWNRSRYEIRADFPRRYDFVAAGDLIDSKEDDGREHVHYRLDKPVVGTSFYFGNFHEQTLEEEGIRFIVHLGGVVAEDGVMRNTATEMKNAYLFYQEYLGELDHSLLHVVGTPTYHGRGFDGILLISDFALRGNWQLLTAHEVAHQWWGNLVSPKSWPEDRWLMESTAEYAAMEYLRAYTTKTGESKRFARDFYNSWILGFTKIDDEPFGTLYGERIRKPWFEIFPLGAGGQDVYNRGAMVLHMLRYMVYVTKGSDDPFWEIMREFNRRYRGDRAGTDEFIALCDEVLQFETGWFFDQWLWTSQIPTVNWSQKLEKDGKSWVLAVDAAQPEDEPPMNLLIPVRMDFGRDRIVEKTMRVKAGKGQYAIRLPAKPRRVELNADWDVLAFVEER